MDRKIQKTYLYEGFGFPLQLIDVPMIKTRGKWVPDINFTLVQEVLVRGLAVKPICLSGNEIKFIRKYFKMTLDAFGVEFGVTHVAVIEWESEGNEQARINPATEKCIRLFVLDTLEKRDKSFRDNYHKIEIKSLAKQQKTRDLRRRKHKPFRINMNELLTA